MNLSAVCHLPVVKAVRAAAGPSRPGWPTTVHWKRDFLVWLALPDRCVPEQVFWGMIWFLDVTPLGQCIPWTICLLENMSPNKVSWPQLQQRPWDRTAPLRFKHGSLHYFKSSAPCCDGLFGACCAMPSLFTFFLHGYILVTIAGIVKIVRFGTHWSDTCSNDMYCPRDASSNRRNV